MLGRDDGRFLRKKFRQAFRCPCRCLQFSPDFAQAAERCTGESGIENKLPKGASAHIAIEHVLGTDPQDADNAPEQQEYRDTCEEGSRAKSRVGRLHGPLHGDRKSLHNRRLVRIGLECSDGREVVAGIGGRIRKRILRGARQAPNRAAEGDERQDDEGNDGEHHGRQLDAREEHHADCADDQYEIAQRLCDHGSDDRFHLRRIGRQPRHHFGGMGDVIEGRAQTGQMCEHISPQIGNHALAQPIDRIEARGARHRQHDPDPSHHCEILVNKSGILGREAQIDHPAHTHGQNECRTSRHEKSEQRQQAHALVSCEIGQETQKRLERAPLARLHGGCFTTGIGQYRFLFLALTSLLHAFGHPIDTITIAARSLSLERRGPS